jgi:hypothetical protein
MMSTALDLSPEAAGSPESREPRERELLRSPGLTQFRRSPFRLLRLTSTATAKQAVWQCDKALARARVGMSLPDPDPVPWLPSGDELDLQESAQTMESPLARLVEQLLWFDDRDAGAEPDHGASLLAALAAADGDALRDYLRASASALPPRARLNRANACLLLGFSALRGCGPALSSSSPSPAAAAAALAWKGQGEAAFVEDPHKAVQLGGLLAGSGWVELLGEGVTAWGELLADPAFADQVRLEIAALADELLTEDDTEAVLTALRTRLADLIVGETKLEMAQGRVDRVAQLSALAGKSKLDAEIWLVAFRPLKSQFQLDLAELAPEAETGEGVIEDVSAYLDRLQTLSQRWRALDEAQLLGLSAMIDEAAAEAFGKLRGVDREQQLTPRFREVLDRIAVVAHSSSIKERIKGYHERLADVQKSMCHFCGKRELEFSACASVSSKRETGRTHHYNQTTISYQVGARPIARCPRCATQHGFIKWAGTATFITLCVWVGLVTMVHPVSWFQSFTMGTGIVLALVCFAGAYGLGFLGRTITSSVITPKGELAFSNYEGTAAVQALRSEGYSWMKYDFRPNAWQLVSVEGVQARHGTDGLEAMKTIGWILVVIVVIGLRVCAH